MMGDHDLRQPPIIDHDMRPPPMMVGDKDMRQPMGDQDLRALGVPPGMSDPHRPYSDPRYRNAPGPDIMPNRGPHYDRARPGPLPPDARSGFDGRPLGMSPRTDDGRNPIPAPTGPGRMPHVRDLTLFLALPMHAIFILVILI